MLVNKVVSDCKVVSGLYIMKNYYLICNLESGPWWPSG